MSSPLRIKPTNPITTQEYHADQLQSVAFDATHGRHFTPTILKNGSAVKPTTHFKPIQTHNSVVVSSPELFDPPAIMRKKLKTAPTMPDFK
tara:strand:- start:623 stop:895 length:273 start_codon:yes stop_codon:yes gene_type:complete